MKKPYEQPKIEIIKLDADIMTTTSGLMSLCTPNGGTDLGSKEATEVITQEED